ncbi:MAG: FAD-dependent oxidoreductase [Deltaproteobacteria bacterium]|nr:FAD-dependent oxidoreductase [Deltaproteobacteria bacterium]MBW2360260.1 FAD-dependent oxidoreductase [Deltaproteobacteria bacterium]
MSADEVRVAVIGAGLAGLAAAYELRRAGIAIAVFERESVAGGRARSGDHEGLLLEPLSPVVSSADHALLDFIAEVGAQDVLLPIRPALTAVVHDGRSVEVDPRRLRDFARMPGVSVREALRLVRLPRLLRRYGEQLAPDAPEAGAALDDRSLADFGRLYFGRSVVDRWMGPFVTSGSLGDPEETSRVHFLRRYCEHFGARRGVLRASLRELAATAAGSIPILFGANVRALRAPPGRPLVIEYLRDGKERSVEVDAVVLAVRADRARVVAAPLLTAGERDVLAGIRYTPAVTLCVRTCRPLSWHPLELSVPRVESGVAETLLLEPGMAGGRVPDGFGGATLHATGTWSAAALDAPDDALEKDLLDELERLQPGARATVDFARVLRAPLARPRFDVGHYRAIEQLTRIETERLAEGRRFVLAGDYRMDPSWNGAVQSGRRAARALLTDLGASDPRAR